jgi:hypothetical protein
MTIEELQLKHNKTMKSRSKRALNLRKIGAGFSLKTVFIVEPESYGKTRAIKNIGSRRGLTVEHGLKIGR